MKVNVITTDIWFGIGRLARQLNGGEQPSHSRLAAFISRLEKEMIHDYISIDRPRRSTYLLDWQGHYIMVNGLLAYDDDTCEWSLTSETTYQWSDISSTSGIIAEIIPRDEYNSRIAAEKEAI